MIKNFTLLLFLFANFSLNAQNINIPDANFKRALVDNREINTNYDEEISVNEAAAFTGTIYVAHHKISSLTGIEYFVNITTLYCSFNKLRSLDLTKNTAITKLSCDHNQLSSLDLTMNTAITDLFCDNNQLSSLDLTKNTAITQLHCYQNQLNSLNLTNNTAITKLYCDRNHLTSLDLTKNTEITKLYCYSNQLSSLDLTKNTAITELFCYSNQLSSLDLTKNTAITKLSCFENQLSSLDLTMNTAITDLFCDNNQLSSLYLTKNTEITSLNCSLNQLSSLDLTKNTAITELWCAGNQLSSLDLTKNTAITFFSCFDNQLSSLDLTNNKAITKLYCDQNQFPFSELQKIKEHYPELGYYSDKRLFSPIDEIINYKIDYSSEVTIDGNETAFKWYKYDSEANNEDINEESKGIFKFLKGGIYYCKMTNPSFPDIVIATNEIKIDFATGTEDILETSTQIYPNPVVSEMVVKFKSNEERTIRIFDLQGRLKLQNEAVSSTERLNLSDFKSGLYFMRVQSENETFTYKIIKK